LADSDSNTDNNAQLRRNLSMYFIRDITTRFRNTANQIYETFQSNDVKKWII